MHLYPQASFILFHIATNYLYIPFLNFSLSKCIFSRVRQRIIVCVTDWLNRWDHGCIIFFSTLRHWHSYHLWRHIHILPLPQLCSLQSTVMLLKELYLYPSCQVSHFKRVSKPNQCGTQLQWPPYETRVVETHWSLPLVCGLLLHLLCHWWAHKTTYAKLPPLTTPNKVTGRATAHRNKQILQQHDRHLKLGQPGF